MSVEAAIRRAREENSTVVPTGMRAAAIDRFGGPEVLTWHGLSVLNMRADEVLIKARYRWSRQLRCRDARRLSVARHRIADGPVEAHRNSYSSRTSDGFYAEYTRRTS